MAEIAIAADAEPIVVFNRVEKSFSGKIALKEISFTIPKGIIVGIVGTNGSGKSTILKLMAGLQRPGKGKVLLNGRQAERLSSRQVAFLPEQDMFYSSFTVEKTLNFYNEMFTDFDRKKAMEMIQSFELQMGQKVAHLSKGNRARLKIVLALARQVPLIIMDEPLSGLDPLVRESIIRSLIATVDMGEQTLVITTHEVEEVEPLLDRAMLIKDGELCGYEEVERIHSEQGIGLVGWMKKNIEKMKRN
ncbi:ABC transporter ATP-binding protein [Paenibacillus eucommiae]|uniref:ABC-2 type transport system ATP-binding protein n=1 Tax=Paenibacillus eucommiae TaxID=1355755 RepID=A0ABS4J536_9BACL|nr:ABC transporter ATP-binding protein [Paenibacillus eucommiae]MBP1994943.1 ABC-2 type transport system ATP-binding protein [Paenibacillus eucommiae]